jgi:hypothetical protein
VVICSGPVRSAFAITLCWLQAHSLLVWSQANANVVLVSAGRPMLMSSMDPGLLHTRECPYVFMFAWTVVNVGVSQEFWSGSCNTCRVEVIVTGGRREGWVSGAQFLVVVHPGNRLAKMCWKMVQRGIWR